METPITYRIVDSFFRNRRLFVLSALLVAGIPSAVLLKRPKTYTATAQIQVIPDVVGTDIGVTSPGPNWITPANQNISQLNDYLTDDSPTGFLHIALTLANRTNPINVDPRALDPRRDLLRKQLTVASVS